MSSLQIIKNVRGEGRSFLLEPEAKKICMEYGIPVTKFEVATNEEEAAKFAEEIGYPVVMKVVSADILHKSDMGGVILNIKDENDVRSAYRRILANVSSRNPNAKVVGILIEEMASPSVEVIVGAIKDPQFSSTLMFGLGGVFVEILKDVTFRVAPINEHDAREMIAELKAYPILKGYRGQPPADVEAIVNILLNVSKLVTDYPEIKELDLNPVKVYEKGARTVDARIILE